MRSHVWRSVNISRDFKFDGRPDAIEIPWEAQSRLDRWKNAGNPVAVRKAVVQGRAAIVLIADLGIPAENRIEVYAQDGQSGFRIASGTMRWGRLSWG